MKQLLPNYSVKLSLPVYLPKDPVQDNLMLLVLHNFSGILHVNPRNQGQYSCHSMVQQNETNIRAHWISQTSSLSFTF